MKNKPSDPIKPSDPRNVSSQEIKIFFLMNAFKLTVAFGTWSSYGDRGIRGPEQQERQTLEVLVEAEEWSS